MTREVKKLKTPPKYEPFAHKEIEDFMGIRILEGKFKGVEYHYIKVALGKDDGKDDTVPLTFSYDIIGKKLAKELVLQFEDTIAAILFDIVETTAKQLEGKSE